MPSGLQINPDELLERTTGRLTRPATLLGHTVSFQDRGEQVVQTLVYEVECCVTKNGQFLHERRFAVYVDGDERAHGLVSEFYADRTEEA